MQSGQNTQSGRGPRRAPMLKTLPLPTSSAVCYPASLLSSLLLSKCDRQLPSALNLSPHPPACLLQNCASVSSSVVPPVTANALLVSCRREPQAGTSAKVGEP